MNIDTQKENWVNLKYKDILLIYKIHVTGLILNINSGKIIQSRIGNKKYLVVTLRTKRGEREYHVHKLVSHMFLEPPLINIGNEMQVNHKDGIKINPKVNNLEWCTQSENILHAYKTGLFSKKTTKLSEFIIREICKLICYGYNSSQISKKINKKFGKNITNSRVCDIRRKYRHSKISDEYFIYTENNEVIPIDKYYITIQ